MAGVSKTVLKKLVNQAVRDRIGSSKIADAIQSTYDYVIVGAGAAGNVLASRLTEDKDVQVLVLEAGGDDIQNPSIHIAASAAELQDSDFNWDYKTTPQQRACRSLNNRQASYPRGKGLGGSGSINYMSYTRGNRYDYDLWHEQGCSGWSFRDVLPYFIKSEGNRNPLYLKSGYHGKDGPLIVSDLQITPLVDTFLQAGQDLGYSITDVNGANQIGFSNSQANVSDGIRWSTAHAYLRPAMERPNLDVAIHTQVAKILFEGKQAVGVEIMQGDEKQEVKVNKEVILSAGAVESPRLLMLSGIGPRKHLEELGVDVRCNLPVGENLQDHPMCVLEYMIERPTSVHISSSYSSQNESTSDYQKYMFFTKGYLGMPGPQGGIAFLRSRLAPDNDLRPDIQLTMACSLVGGIFKKLWNMKGEVYDALHQEEDVNKHGMYLSTLLLHPRSHGNIRLKSTNPTDHPIIDPKFLEHPDDARVLVEGLRMQLQLGNTKAFETVGAKISQRCMPKSSHTLWSDDYLDDYVRHQTLTGHHATGTCKMGPPGSVDSVVDPELRVIGMKGLRVVDASVMPSIPSGNTGTPTVMIAERCADLIRGVNTVSHIKLSDEILEAESHQEKAKQ